MSLRFILAALLCSLAAGQTTPRQVGAVLERPLHSSEVAAHQLHEYILRKLPPPSRAASAAEWAATAQRLRRRFLDEVVFYGWPREWVDSPLRVEDLGPVPSGKGYRVRKLRYEVVPGFYSTGILYEPDPPRHRAPAVLNVHGHVGREGKAIEYKQKRCIHQALQGIVALSLEWLQTGDLASLEYGHSYFVPHLDLAGVNGLGLFYLQMRRGLDYLSSRPDVDNSRIGITGLSGGGWQSLVLGALDERVAVAVPVAGYMPMRGRLARPKEIGCFEMNGTDMLPILDYEHLTAMRAPRPTLLIYNAEDDCCFRAPLVKPLVFDAVKPIFGLFGGQADFAWHENTDPSTHNYQQDNRLQAYRFFAKHFALPPVERELPVDGEIRSLDELRVELPENSLTVLGLARRLAAQIQHPPVPLDPLVRRRWAVSQRQKLARVLRYRPTAVTRAWAIDNSRASGIETIGYRLDFDTGLSATAVWLKAAAAPAGGPLTLVLNDSGKPAMAEEISGHLNRGRQVLAVDLLFNGDAAPKSPNPYDKYCRVIYTAGDRPLGLQAAQLIGIARWANANFGVETIHVSSTGMRNQVRSLVAVGLEPSLFSTIITREGFTSLSALFDRPIEYLDAPDLFCLDLFKEFEIDILLALAQSR